MTNKTSKISGRSYKIAKEIKQLRNIEFSKTRRWIGNVVWLLSFILLFWIIYTWWVLLEPFGFLLIAWIIIIQFLEKLDFREELIKEILELQRILNSTEKTIEEIDQILPIIQNIYTRILTIKDKVLSNNFIFSESGKTKLKNVWTVATKIALRILSNLRSDLQFRLEEQQKTLESAKSEVENNIHWTTELNAISELQITRLDKQIEQFEELQRVLVKI